MNKVIFSLILILPMFLFGQKKIITYEQASKSNDITVLAKFIKENPNHPKRNELKRKMMAMMSSTKPKVDQSKIEKPAITSKVKTKVSKSSSLSAQNKKTAALLTHIFNNDTSSKNVYLQIINNSNCNLIIKINGKKFYNITVPAKGQNFILVDKGRYTLTSSICDTKYFATKNIYRDISITLNHRMMKK